MKARPLLYLVVLTAAACGPSGGGHHATGKPVAVGPILAGSPSEIPKFSNVVVVVLENKEYEQVIGNSDAPYINRLAKRFAVVRRFYGIRHPSLPNYLALLGGSAFGISTDCTACHVRGRNLVDQLEAKGISWKAYMEGMPKPCYQGDTYGNYARRHNPFLYFDNISKDPARCAQVVPLRRLGTDLSKGRLPRFAWITPNVCHDMHDCGVRSGDKFLHRRLPPLLHALGPRGVLFLTFDEGATNAGCCRLAQGGHIVTIVAGPAAVPEAESGLAFDHYSILRTIEDGWRLHRMRHARCTCTRTLKAFF